ncbi:MAG: GAF domain-containing protein [Anaerolineae bacterium]|nr:GAF domain-containing protein [Anaerolineae bacterium]
MNLSHESVEPQGLAATGGALQKGDERDAVVLEGLRPATLVLGILFLVLGATNIAMSSIHTSVLAPVTIATASVFLILHVWLVRRQTIPVGGNALAAVVAALVTVNSLLHLALSGNPAQTTNLVLVVVGSGYLLTSTRWLSAILVLTSTGWWLVARLVVDLRDWRQFGYALILSSALAVIIHMARNRNQERLSVLRHETESRSRMLRRRAQQLETLMSISHSINGFLDLDALLNHIVDEVQASFGYDYVGILLTDASRKALTCRASITSAGTTCAPGERELSVGDPGLVGWAAEHRESVYVGDVSQDARYAESAVLPETRSQMVLPLEMNEVLLGVLDMRSTRRNAFSEDDLRVCESLADQVATALQNAARFELERSRRLLTETLHQVGYALSQTLDLTEVLDLIIGSLGKLVPFDRGAVLLASGPELEIVAARGFPDACDPREIRVSIREDDVFDRIVQTKAPLSVPELEGRSDWEYVEPLPRARSWVGLPLVDESDEVIGMLSLTREHPDPYSDDEIELGTAYAHQAAAALQNARLYQELSEAYTRLEHLDRAKSDFIALASHELRTPLTLTIGYSHLLAEEPVIRHDAMVMQMVDGLTDGAERLREIVNCLMDVAEIESETLQLHLGPMHVRYVIEEEVLRFAESLKARKIALHLEPLDKLPKIEGDRIALRKVFHHLIMNAIKFTPDGGEITIQGSTVAPGYRGIPGPGIEITVKDTGVGIARGYQERIFDTFFRTGEISLHSSSPVKFQGGGPGLGLAIVKGVVESHKGQVWVESEGFDPDTCPGSCFHILLPLAPNVMPGCDASALWGAMGYYDPLKPDRC